VYSRQPQFEIFLSVDSPGIGAQFKGEVHVEDPWVHVFYARAESTGLDHRVAFVAGDEGE